MDATVTAPLGIVVGVSMLYMFGFTQNVTPFGLFVAGVLAVLVAFLGRRVNRRRVVLYEDGIVVLGAFSTRTLKRNEILGRRMGKLAWQAGGGSFYIIVPADRDAKELRLPPFLALDKYFFSWMKGMPMIESKRRNGLILGGRR